MDNEFAEAPMQAYQDLYDNTGGMLDDLVRFWEHSAKAWLGHPGIIGFEIMNEPFAGNAYADPTILLPGEAGRRNLQRMNDAVAAAVRISDPDRILFFEPVTWGMIFDGNITGSGYTHVPGGSQFAARSAFSYQYACTPSIFFGFPAAARPAASPDERLFPIS